MIIEQKIDNELAMEKSIEYFNGEELPASVFVNKYALRNNDMELQELTPEDMHRRIAREFARIESGKFKDPYTEDEIFSYLEGFEKVIPQGSPMYGIGNPYQTISLSNCYVVEPPEDSYGGICLSDQQLVQISKRRGGVGLDLSKLRPDGALTKNAAKTSTGIIPFLERYSNSIREVGQCISKGQRVLTRNGLVPIEKVKIGDYVWTKIGWNKVINKFNNGKKKVFKIKTSYGYEVIASKDHKFQTIENDNIITRILDDFEAGDDIILIPGNVDMPQEYCDLDTDIEWDYDRFDNKSNRLVEYDLPKFLHEDLAYVLGYSYGDGSVEFDKFDEESNLDLACSNDWSLVKEKIDDCVFNTFGKKTNKRSGDGLLERVSIKSKFILRFLRKNKILKEKTHDIVLPDIVKNSPISVQMSFISGYFDADGYASGKKKGYCFNSVSRSFLRDVQDILFTVGICSKIHVEKRVEKTEGRWSDVYSLCIVGSSSQEKALELLGSSVKIKDKNFVSKRDCFVTPYKSKTFKFSSSKYSYCPDNSQYMSIKCFEKIKKEEGIDQETLLKDSIVSIEEVGERETHDLTVENEHWFYCEGFYVKNSGRRGALMTTLSVHHPEVLNFAKIKNDLTKVTGSNISVRLSDEFLTAVENKETYELRWPVDARENGEEPKISMQVEAIQVWKEIIKNAHAMAEPGLLFWDNIINESPADCYAKFGFRSVATNPCCFAKDSDVFVVTKDGVKEIKEVTSDDLIYVNETDSYEKTSGYFDAGNAEVYKVCFKNGEELLITGNHKLCKVKNKRVGTRIEKTEGDLVELNNLEIGDEISIHTNSPSKMNDFGVGTYEEGLILGWLSGDGCLSYHDDKSIVPDTILSFWSHEHDAGEYIVENAKDIGYNWSLGKNSCNEVKTIRSCVFTKDFTEKYQENIWHFRSKSERISMLDKASIDLIRGYIQARFTADGTVTCNVENKNYNIQLSSVNFKQIKQIQNLLLLFGIKSSFGILREEGESDFGEGRGGVCKTKTCYRITITGIEYIRTFFEDIGGMISESKNNKLRYISSLENSKTNKCSNFTKIKSIESIGVRETGCIEVENSHKFTANGIISGNSELPLCPNDSCRLLVINLMHCVKNAFTKKASFDFETLRETAYFAQRMMDNLVDLEIECVSKIISKIKSDPEDISIKRVELDLWKGIRDKCEQTIDDLLHFFINEESLFCHFCPSIF